MNASFLSVAGAAACAAMLGLLLSGCAMPAASLPASAAGLAPNVFKPVARANVVAPLSRQELALLEETVNPVYRIGSGDVLRLSVYGRGEVSGSMVVGPDGKITLPIVGAVDVSDASQEAAQQKLETLLRQYYTKPAVTLAIEQYTSNQVTVLGRVERSGVQKFPHPPTLAEVLAGAGAMPILDKQATLTRCAIMRGRDKLIWVDLKALLNGDPAYNMRMKKGDIVFIPDSSETTVYVLGAIGKPGSYRLTPRMTVLDALSQAGGPTDDAAPERIGVYRAGAGMVEIIRFSDLVDVSRRANYALEDGDVVFVPKSGLAEVGYLMRQISPVISVLTFGLTASTLAK